ncbi:MAG: hypothetical protein P8X89_08360 [Reinekea sp.]
MACALRRYGVNHLFPIGVCPEMRLIIWAWSHAKSKSDVSRQVLTFIPIGCFQDSRKYHV